MLVSFVFFSFFLICLSSSGQHTCFLSLPNTLRQINAQLILKTIFFTFIAKTDVLHYESPGLRY